MGQGGRAHPAGCQARRALMRRGRRARFSSAQLSLLLGPGHVCPKLLELGIGLTQFNFILGRRQKTQRCKYLGSLALEFRVGNGALGCGNEACTYVGRQAFGRRKAAQ